MQIAGNVSAVKQALLSVSILLHENPGTDPVHSSSAAPSGGMHSSADTVAPQEDPFPHRGHSSGRYHADYHKRSYSHGPGRMIGEEEVIFKILCQQAKVGSLIGKGGSVVRAIENDTGAYIKIADMIPETDERIVVISAREVLQLYQFFQALFHSFCSVLQIDCSFILPLSVWASEPRAANVSCTGSHYACAS